MDVQLNQTIQVFPGIGQCPSNNCCVARGSYKVLLPWECSLKEGYTISNKKCVDSSSKKKESKYLYCRLEDGSWDHCSIERNRWKETETQVEPRSNPMPKITTAAAGNPYLGPRQVITNSKPTNVPFLTFWTDIWRYPDLHSNTDGSKKRPLIVHVQMPEKPH